MKTFNKFLLLTGLIATSAMAMKVANKTHDAQTIVGATNSEVFDMRQYDMAHIEAVIDVNTPAAGAFTCAVTDICTDSAHDFTTGLKGQASTTGALPAGLDLTTDYFVIVLSANTYKLASSLANALAGTAIDITDTGSGTHTFTPTSIAGGSIKIQRSSNYNFQTATGDWVDVTSSATNVTADGNLDWSYADVAASALRAVSTATAGRYSVIFTQNKKGRSAQ